MNLFWLWVGAGCAASAVCGFSAVRIGARSLARAGTDRASPREPGAPAITWPEPAPMPAPAGPPPTVPQPEPEKLEAWAAQVRAGERKMSVATDGCRVTWHRICKHGHPAWLVHLGYLDDVPSSPPPAASGPSPAGRSRG